MAFNWHAQDAETAYSFEEYSEIRSQIERAGKPLPCAFPDRFIPPMRSIWTTAWAMNRNCEPFKVG